MSPRKTPRRETLAARFDDGLTGRVRAVATDPQLVLAAKAALAAAIAWTIANALPGTPSEYPYYAPLGALLAMYPTVAGTLTQGLQTVAGLTIGIVLAYLAVWAGDPNWLTIAFVVGMGVLLAGRLKRTAGGGTGIASAGLFVLVIGNDNLGYSLAYFVQTIVGVVVGLAVSGLIFPPLNFNDAVGQMSSLRRMAAQDLQEMGQALEEDWAEDDPRWARRRDDLMRSTRNARDALRYADESRKGNVRWRFHPRDITRDYYRVEVLQTVASHTLNITNMLQDALHGTSHESPMPESLRPVLQEAFTAVGQVLDLWTVEESDGGMFLAAQQRLRALERAAYETVSPDVPFGAAAAIGMSLHRILQAVMPDLRVESSD
ncbi:FUSC family protein [Arthrobacter echini]|uniref:FUSC family protein n=1 Tax=Arthrobacter echini TaxID=1529066 RepID=A0A4S5E9X0_9MICC|nr:FUSC family protein [Arthrobacter echini]THJ68501.1 FUSC family protein [Arthrobacter echini]